jgi:hypothetical protein
VTASAVGHLGAGADEVRDFAGDAETVHTVVFRLPSRPDEEWLIVAIPARTAYLDDRRRTARNIALDVAAEIRATAERVTYETVLERRRG